MTWMRWQRRWSWYLTTTTASTRRKRTSCLIVCWCILLKGLHLVLCARHDPPLSLGTLRVREAMREIRMHELQFSEHATATLIERCSGRAISQVMAAGRSAELYRGVAGWRSPGGACAASTVVLPATTGVLSAVVRCKCSSTSSRRCFHGSPPARVTSCSGRRSSGASVWRCAMPS
jgi:hypothetical protein